MLTAETFLALLEQRRISISELARRAGVARPDLSVALRGQRTATRGYWLDVGAALDLTADEVTALLEPEPAGAHGKGLNTLWRARA